MQASNTEQQNESLRFVEKVAISIFGKGTKTFENGYMGKDKMSYAVYLRNVHVFDDYLTFNKLVQIKMVNGMEAEDNRITSMERVRLIVTLRDE